MIMVTRKNSLDQKGAASMIVVIFMSIILTVLTIGFVRIALDEQRQATDDDLSSRAYYAAESGLEDAKRAVGDYTDGTITSLAALNGDVCEPPVGYNSLLSEEFGASYTCQLIDFTPATYRAEFTAPNQTRQIDINPVDADGDPVSNLRTIVIKWHINDTQGNDGDGLLGVDTTLKSESDNSLPTLTSWSHPALFEIGTYAYTNGNISSSTIDSERNLAFPTDKSSPTTYTAGGGAAVDGTLQDASCDEAVLSGEYACEIRINLSGPPNKVLRLTNWYATTTAEISLLNASGDPVFFEGAQVLVDVTGKAGEVFRRVEAVIDVNPPSILPNFAIQSATDICKNFSITDNPSDFVAADNTSCE